MRPTVTWLTNEIEIKKSLDKPLLSAAIMVIIKLTSKDMNQKRNEQGKFISISDKEALHPKSIGVRISKSRVEKFGQICHELGRTPTELVREIVHGFIDDFEEK